MSATAESVRPEVGKKRRGSALLPGLLFVAWLGGLWILSSLPGQTVNTILPHFPNVDKVAHFGNFAVGGFLLAWLLRQALGWRTTLLLCVTVGILTGIGALDEIHQLFTPHRSGADLGDWITDFLGALTGAGVWLFIHGKIFNRFRPPKTSP